MATSTHWKLADIEVALAKTDKFNFVRNIVAFNVNGWGNNLPIFHECDMLVLSKAGYLTEIEIKRSLADFKKDFEKEHMHSNSDLIKNFYYCVPEIILDKARDFYYEHGIYECTGFISFPEETLDNRRGSTSLWSPYYDVFTFNEAPNVGKKKRNYRKLTDAEQFQIARFGAMRSIGLKEKIINLEKEIKNLKEML